MNLLFTGRGKSASWGIRGEQLAHAMGAQAIPNALDVSAFDVAVVVKRAPLDLCARIRKAGVLLVWDVVDAWTQPEGNNWSRHECMEWLRGSVKAIKPDAIVAATNTMAADCAEFGVPVLALPHHSWPDQGQCEVRERVQTVGYQGGEKYLGRWDAFMQKECARRGWRFVVNPQSVSTLDIVVALREADGYAPRNWKSGVKLANAQGSGTPFIGNREAGYLETASGRELWADTEIEMVRALDAFTPQLARMTASARMVECAPRLGKVAKQYGEWLRGLRD